VLFQPADGSLVLLNLFDGRHFTLEQTGRRIWELSDGTRTVAEIVAAICAEYNAETVVVEADTLELLGELASDGLLAAAA
jgi:hypothetical protein